MKTIMAIGAHIGDMELTCGAYLASEYLKGNKIITVALTAGERGNPPYMTPSEYRVQKVNEAKEFASMLGGEAVVLDYPDGELPDNEEVRLEVANLMRKYKADIVLTHFKNSLHKDHERCSKIVREAQLFAGIDMGDKVEGKAIYVPIYYCENWEDKIGFDRYIMVDVTKGYELWCEAVKKHWFVTSSKDFKYYQYYTNLTAVVGALAKCERAVAFDIDAFDKYLIKDSLL